MEHGRASRVRTAEAAGLRCSWPTFPSSGKQRASVSDSVPASTPQGPLRATGLADTALHAAYVQGHLQTVRIWIFPAARSLLHASWQTA